ADGAGPSGYSTSLVKITEFSGTAQSYGQAFDTSNIFETHSEEIIYCDLSGSVSGKTFEAKKFATASQPYDPSQPLNGIDCKHVDYDTYNGRYFKDGVDITDKLIKDKDGYAYDKICTVTVKTSLNLSSSNTIPTT